MAGSPHKLRILNDQAALAFILESGTVSRAELGGLTGLSKPGVAELLTRLETAGLIEQAGTRPGGPGPAARTWRVRRGVGHAVAVDLTPRGLRSVVLDLDGTQLGARHTPWSDVPSPDTVSAEIESLLGAAELSVDQVLHAVIGVPGAVDPRTGIIHGVPNLPGLVGYDFGGAVSERLGITVHVENDVNLMALGAVDAASRGVRDFAFVWIDEGFGAAIIRDGELIRGFAGGAGEIDRVSVPDAAAQDPAAGLKLGYALGPEVLESLTSPLPIAPGEPAQAPRPTAAPPDFAGDALAIVIRRVAMALVPIVTVLDPELVLLGGAYGAVVGERWAGDVREELERLLGSGPSFIAEIRPYPVGPEAALAGAIRIGLAHARRTAFKTGSLIDRPSPPLADTAVAPRSRATDFLHP